jgi:hypothetical protein
MNHIFKQLLVVSAASALSLPAFASSFAADVKLSPAGSFKAQTKKVEGFAYKTSDGGVAAENVMIDLRTITTGVSLRDKHTKEHLLVQKYPEAKLIKASGKGGKGKATIQIRGKTREVSGTYKVSGDHLTAEFPMNLTDIDIKDVRYMGIGVKDLVNVTIEVPLKTKKSGT